MEAQTRLERDEQLLRAGINKGIGIDLVGREMIWWQGGKTGRLGSDGHVFYHVKAVNNKSQV